MARIDVAGTELQFDCAPDDSILRAALRAGLGMSYSCNVGSCGNCRFELLEGSVHHRRLDSPAYSERDRKKNRWLGCQAIADGDCKIAFRPDPQAAPSIAPQKRQAKMVARRMLNHDIAELSFEISGKPDFLPGQYALFSLPSVEGERVYSMANLPDDGLWRFMIRRVQQGAMTGALFDQLAIGATVGLDGPYGLAHLRAESGRKIVLLAGGSGLSPMVSIARGALKAAVAPRIDFFFGGRSPADVAAGDFLREIEDPRFHYHAAISDPDQDGDWTGPRGFIHELAISLLGADLVESEIYFAGPPAMASAIGQALHALGVPPAQIHFDEFY